MALRMALHLNEHNLIKQVLEEIPYTSIAAVAKRIGPEQLERLMNTIAKVMGTSPHVQYYLSWSLEMLKTHGIHMDKQRSSFLRAFRAMHKIVQTKHDDLQPESVHARFHRVSGHAQQQHSERRSERRW